MFSRSKVKEGIEPNSPIRDPILKSWFLNLDKKEVDNVNKGDQRLNKHVKLWAKNAFNEWKVFHSFDTRRSIANLLENESSIKNLVDVLSSLILQVVNKDGACILQPSNFYLLILN
jgi:hypothetical protein